MSARSGRHVLDLVIYKLLELARSFTLLIHFRNDSKRIHAGIENRIHRTVIGSLEGIQHLHLAAVERIQMSLRIEAHGDFVRVNAVLHVTVLLDRKFNTLGKDVVDGAYQVHLHGIYLSREHRDIGTLVLSLSDSELPLVEVSEDIDAETERNRRLEHGHMIFERLVKVLQSTHCQCITVNLKHEREDFQPIVADKAAH